ncbi:MAG TPA: Gfo/Idh/MocA family oxidoreductase, partial [Propionibacteriaceae bacterium]|nr:Gfo/Idh/MocA family oxidoreductase [Propionibacteriaceae bacterium]
MTDRLRVAILGAGMIGGVHRRAAMLAGADVVGVMASSPTRSDQVAIDWNLPHSYPNIDAVAAADVDLVHVCTPNASHVHYATTLMRAGKHVICEKPLGLSFEEAQQAASVAAETGVENTMPFAYRFHPMVREMRARVQDAGFGGLNLIHGSYLQDWML